MAFGGFNDGKQPAPMAEINVTPMVDVMLVLVVIFIITAPFFTHAVKLDLPQAQSAPAPANAETIALSIAADGTMYWNGQATAMTEIDTRMEAAAKKNPQPELHLRADKATRYEIIAKVMAAAQAAGLSKMGFVTDPRQAPAGSSR